MPTKAELYAQMADKVATQLTGSWQEWAGFLTTASRDVYKRQPMDEQSFPLMMELLNCMEGEKEDGCQDAVDS